MHSQGPSDGRTLAALDALLTDTPYSNYNRETTLTTEEKLYDQRNLVTLSRFPIVEAKIVRDTSPPGSRPRYQMATAHPPDQTADPVEWERPMLHTRIDIGNGRTLHALNLHLKSKIASSVVGQKIDRFTWRTVSGWAEGSFVASLKRVGQALQARLLVDQIFDQEGLDSLIALCGDFNAETEDVPLKTICGNVEDTGNPAHAPRQLIPCENNIPKSVRYSLFHLGRGQMLDHIVASRPLLSFMDHAEVHNEALPDESGAFRQDTKFPESDHAPVIAEFRL